MLGQTFVHDNEPIYKSQFDRIFLRAILFGALQNAYDCIENSSFLARSLPITLRLINYRREILVAGLKDGAKSSLGINGRLVLKAISDIKGRTSEKEQKE